MPTFVLAFFMRPLIKITAFLLLCFSLSTCKHSPPQKGYSEGVLIDSLQRITPKIPAYSKDSGACKNPLSPFSFSNALHFLEEASSDVERVELGKKLIDKNCITAYQLSRFLQTISGDQWRLSLAQYAYPKIYDRENWMWLYEQLRYDWNKAAFLNIVQHSD